MTTPKTSKQLQLEVEQTRAQIEELSDERDELIKLIGVARRQAMILGEEMRRAQIREAEEELQRSLSPDFNDPEYQKLLHTLEKTDQYKVLRPFQKEGLAKVLWSYLRETKPDHEGSRGFINADDAGLGKTLSTVAFIATLELLEEEATHA